MQFNIKFNLPITLFVVLHTSFCPLISLGQDNPATSSTKKTNAKSELDLAAELYRSGKYSDALKHFRTIAESGSDNGDARIMMGYCYVGLKKYQEALKEYNQAAKEGKLISIRNKAQGLASRLDTEMKGICPGNCLKPSMPGWHKMNVPGTPDRLVWMVFPYLDPAGKGGSEYWSNDHMGEVIEYVNGRPVNKGKCPICHGTTHYVLPK